MIQNLIFGILFFRKYYFEHKIFLYSSGRSSGHHQSFFFNFRFSSRKPQSQKKLAKKITHFTIQFQKISLILRMSTHLSLKIICSRNTAKNLSNFTNFPASMFLWSTRKKTFVLQHFSTPKNCILEAL